MTAAKKTDADELEPWTSCRRDSPGGITSPKRGPHEGLAHATAQAE
jgi:hypothetical protein